MGAAEQPVYPKWGIALNRFLQVSRQYCRLHRGLVGFWKGYYKYKRIRRKHPHHSVFNVGFFLYYNPNKSGNKNFDVLLHNTSPRTKTLKFCC